MTKNMMDAYSYVGKHRAETPGIAERLRSPGMRRVLGTLAVVGAVAANTLGGQPAISYSEVIGSAPAVVQTVGQDSMEIPLPEMFSDQSPARFVERLTGIDRAPAQNFGVAGTDLLVPFDMGNGKTGYWGGDTFGVYSPNEATMVGRNPGEGVWRSNVMLISDTNPTTTNSAIEFNDAAGVEGNGLAPELMTSEHDTSGEGTYSDIPTSGFIANGKTYAWFQSVGNWDQVKIGDQVIQDWATNDSYLGVSEDGGNTFKRTTVKFENDDVNSDSLQMVSAAVDETTDEVYMTSTKAGRQVSGIMLSKVKTGDVENQTAYQYWTGTGWSNNQEDARSLFGEQDKIAETSLMGIKGKNGLAGEEGFAISYLKPDEGVIVTRYADSPDGKWSEEKVQVTAEQVPNLYGGFIHPDSKNGKLTLIVSSWVRPGQSAPGDPGRYDTSQFSGTLGKPVVKIAA